MAPMARARRRPDGSDRQRSGRVAHFERRHRLERMDMQTVVSRIFYFVAGFLAFPVMIAGGYGLTLWQTRKERYR